MIWPIIGKFFLACLAGQILATIILSLRQSIADAPVNIAEFAVIIVFGFPFCVVGLLPISLIGGALGRWTRLPPMLLIALATLAGGLLGRQMLPRDSVADIGATTGSSVAFVWAVLTFYSTIVRRANARQNGNFDNG